MIKKINTKKFVLQLKEDNSDLYEFDENREVKTTKGGLNNIFRISKNAVCFSKQYKDKYYLYRVYNFNPKTMSANLKIIKESRNRTKLQASNYICRSGGK